VHEGLAANIAKKCSVNILWRHGGVRKVYYLDIHEIKYENMRNDARFYRHGFTGV